MKIHSFRETPPEWLGLALERFEHQFQYPLGSGETFRISHGREYLPFFAAMGTATLLVAEQAGAVMGTLVRVERCIECRRRKSNRCNLEQQTRFGRVSHVDERRAECFHRAHNCGCTKTLRQFSNRRGT